MRLIDADALLEEKLAVPIAPVLQEERSVYWRWMVPAEMIKDCPTVDAVPIVRCKDCKHYNGEDRDICCPLADYAQSKCGADWFCADAERRTDG